MEKSLFNKVRKDLLNAIPNDIDIEGMPEWRIYNDTNIGIAIHINTAILKSEAIKILQSTDLLNYLKGCGNKAGDCDQINLLNKKVFIVCRSRSLFAVTDNMDVHV